MEEGEREEVTVHFTASLTNQVFTPVSDSLKLGQFKYLLHLVSKIVHEIIRQALTINFVTTGVSAGS